MCYWVVGLVWVVWLSLVPSHVHALSCELILGETYLTSSPFVPGDHWQIFAIRAQRHNLYISMDCGSSHRVYTSTHVYLRGCTVARGLSEWPDPAWVWVIGGTLFWRRRRNSDCGYELR